MKDEKPAYTLGQIFRLAYGGPIPEQVLNLAQTDPAAALTVALQKAGHSEGVATLVERLPPTLSGPVSDVDFAPFWLGFYHYLSASEAAKKYGKAELEAAGHALYGGKWQTDLSRALGLNDARRIRQWMSDERPIPAGVWADIAGLLRSRKLSIDAVLERFDKA